MEEVTTEEEKPEKKVDGRKTRKRATSPKHEGVRPKRNWHPSVRKRWSEAHKKRCRDHPEVVRRNVEAAARAGGRSGVPDGMRKREALVAWAKARESAKETIAKMIENKVLTDDEKANEALETALTIMRGPSTHQRDKLSAARTVLEWTKAKPAQKQEVSIQKAEDWLALVTADAAKDPQ